MGHRFLLVEDSVIDTELVCHWLHREFPDANIVCASKASDGLENFKPGVYSAGFINLKLQGDPYAGLEVIRKIRKQEADLPLFVVTGAETEELRQLAVRAQATGFFSKDFDGSEAISVRNIIEFRNAAQDKGRNMNVIKSWISNKHTSSASLVALGLGVAAIIWPEYKEKLDAIFKLAVTYGLLMGGDALRKDQNPPKQEVE